MSTHRNTTRGTLTRFALALAIAGSLTACATVQTFADRISTPLERLFATQQGADIEPLVLDFDSDEVTARADSVKQVLARAAVLADASTKPTTMTVQGSIEDRVWMTQVIRERLSPGTLAVLAQADGSTARLVLTPGKARR